MSLIGLCLNMVLAILLVAGLVIGVRLERRLKTVREGQEAFARAVVELDAAAIKARNGLADLRAATDEATDLLGGRITRAREAAERLESLVRRAEAMPSPTAQVQPQLQAQPQPHANAMAGAEGGLVALLERIKQAELGAFAPEASPVRAAPAAERPTRVRPSVDEDLFEDFGGRL
jgi:hypothetical protein